MPTLWPELRSIDRAHHRLPKDQEGRTSHAEICSWMEEEGVTDRCVRALLFDLFAALDIEMSEIHGRRMQRLREEAEEKAGRRR